MRRARLAVGVLAGLAAFPVLSRAALFGALRTESPASLFRFSRVELLPKRDGGIQAT